MCCPCKHISFQVSQCDVSDPHMSVIDRDVIEHPVMANMMMVVVSFLFSILGLSSCLTVPMQECLWNTNSPHSYGTSPELLLLLLSQLLYNKHT